MMKNSNKNLSITNCRGSILIVCLVLAAVGTLGVAAWISLLDARGHLAEQSITGMDRRVRYRNGKIMAYQTMLTRHLHASTVPTSLETYSLPLNWGNITVNSYSELPLSTITATRTSKTGARPFTAFTSDVSVGISDGLLLHPWEFRLKSYNPILGGELFTMLPTSEVVNELPVATGTINVKGRAVFWGTGYQTVQLSVKAEQFLVPDTSFPALSYKDPNDNTILPTNHPFVRQTSGYVGTVGNYNGQASVVADPANTHNTYISRIPTITSFATIDGTYATLVGNAKFANGDGPATAPGQANDTLLIARINDPLVSNTTLSTELIAASPLSSAVLFNVLSRIPMFTEVEARPILYASFPLPDDIVAEMGANTGLFPGGLKEEIYAANNSSVVADAVGGVWVNLNDPNIPHLILQNFTSLYLNGQPDETAADARANDEPRVIVISNSDNVKLDSVKLTDYNRRRLVLAIKNIGVLDNVGLLDHEGNPNTSGTNHTVFGFVKDVSTTPFKDWRILCEFEGITADFDLSDIQGLNLIGGIRTNHSLNVSGGTLTIDRETNSDLFAPILCRSAWIEAVRITPPAP